MEDTITLRKWQLGAALFIPFLGIINPVLYLGIFVTYFLFWGYILTQK